MAYREILGATLRERRQKQGRTLRDVAIAGHTSLGYLSEIERGHKNVDHDLLEMLCEEGLNIPLSDILLEAALKLRDARNDTISDEQLNKLITEESVGTRP